LRRAIEQSLALAPRCHMLCTEGVGTPEHDR
jgi:hypothetical protein